MKTNELRIGNYVMYADVICKVEGYSKGFLETNGVNSLISKFQPIALTEDWLIKLGFEKRSYGYFYIDFKNVDDALILFPFTSGHKFNGMWGVAGMPQLIKKIEFVHNLQNLYYSLTNDELQYKNTQRVNSESVTQVKKY